MMLIAGCGPKERTIADPVPGVALSRQRTVSRAQFGFRWPLTVGVGTLACDDRGTILFRTRGITYGLSGRPAGSADIASIGVVEPSPPPSNPLKRITQNERMEAFEAMMRCVSLNSIDERCRNATLARFRLSRDEWRQIEVEGRERHWPPLARELMSLDPLLSAGRALCAPASGR
jgi:hypothetical protein